jgi:hypothetical protein
MTRPALAVTPACSPPEVVKKYGERRLIPVGRRKQHTRRIALIEVDKPSRALATVETDFGDTLGQ